MMDPEKRTKYEEEAAAIKENKGEVVVKELDRATIIMGLNRLEGAKYDAQQTMYELVRQGRSLKPEMINNIIKLEEIKAHDKFFLEMGFEDEQLDLNIQKQNLKDDKEILAVFETWAQKSADWLQEKSDEAKELSAKMRGNKPEVEQKKEEVEEK